MITINIRKRGTSGFSDLGCYTNCNLALPVIASMVLISIPNHIDLYNWYARTSWYSPGNLGQSITHEQSGRIPDTKMVS